MHIKPAKENSLKFGKYKEKLIKKWLRLATKRKVTFEQSIYKTLIMK
ncbi:hypothetical protein ENTCAN_05130 [Enterobacter cancerogenus ATCC 35316]|jgi:hypothetical protein|nr:hypothetical protein ENTCAN_05130 [Enterobacter cancerogenus ATCC 35316]